MHFGACYGTHTAMKLFSRLYTRVMRWAKHRHAPYYLAGLSFTESSFFPIPPDVMLAPMSLAEPKRAWFYATITTFCSTLGALLGYLIGTFFLLAIHPLIVKFGYVQDFNLAQHWFDQWGFWVLFLAAFTPLPFKMFTIAAGAVHMPLLPFIIGSFIGRGSRFYLVSALMRWGGEPFERWLRTWIDIIGWGTLLIIIIALFIWR